MLYNITLKVWVGEYNPTYKQSKKNCNKIGRQWKTWCNFNIKPVYFTKHSTTIMHTVLMCIHTLM